MSLADLLIAFPFSQFEHRQGLESRLLTMQCILITGSTLNHLHIFGGLPPCLLSVKYNLVLRGDQITDWVQENELPLAWAFLKRREYELKYQANCTGRQAKASYLSLPIFILCQIIVFQLFNIPHH